MLMIFPPEVGPPLVEKLPPLAAQLVFIRPKKIARKGHSVHRQFARANHGAPTLYSTSGDLSCASLATGLKLKGMFISAAKLLGCSSIA